ncbi:MAG: non-canonical purine NTP pyrophosphatase [Candidatus Krumholzibacteriota bacterium]|nr:non-canonical purine NTP pyrophosphatase [Candidatus Krumholzibacteriota bacterium]
MKLVLATHNWDKAREIRKILDGLDVEVSTLDEFEGAPHTVEDGTTLEENALKKACEIRDFTGESALADDTALEVDALDGAPGIYAARFAGEDATYDDNCNKILAELDGVAESDRTARFRTVIALALSSRDAEASRERLSEPQLGRRTDTFVTEGVLVGTITTAKRGESGFGYDSVFLDPISGRTLAEMSAEEKNAISHRYRALVEMREMLLRSGLAHEVS